MDEFLLDRVNELREIDERLERLERLQTVSKAFQGKQFIADLRSDLAIKIQHAQEAYNDF